MGIYLASTVPAVPVPPQAVAFASVVVAALAAAALRRR